MQVYQTGQKVHSAALQVPAHCRQRTAGWSPQCLQTGYWNGRVCHCQDLPGNIYQVSVIKKIFWPDIFMAVHVHGVKLLLLLLLHLLLLGLVFHALQHLISDVLGEDGQQEFFLCGNTFVESELLWRSVAAWQQEATEWTAVAWMRLYACHFMFWLSSFRLSCHPIHRWKGILGIVCLFGVFFLPLCSNFKTLKTGPKLKITWSKFIYTIIHSS